MQVPEENTENKWLSIGKAARFLGISRDTLRRWGKSGKIRTIRSPTNRRYYTLSQLKAISEGKLILPEQKVKPSRASGIDWFQLVLISFLALIITVTAAILGQSLLH